MKSSYHHRNILLYNNMCWCKGLKDFPHDVDCQHYGRTTRNSNKGKKAGLKEKSTQDYQRGVDDGKKMASEESYKKGLKEGEERCTRPHQEHHDYFPEWYVNRFNITNRPRAARIHAVVWRSFLDFVAIAGIAGLVVGFFPR